ncbi:MAG: hypothetical protein Kow0075_06860 [Salibacteraceae bacterium]
MRYLFLLFAIILPALANAQRGKTDDNRAMKAYVEARELVRAGKYEEAEEKFLAAIRRDEKFLDPRMDLAEYYLISGQKAKAKEMMEEIVRIDWLYQPSLIVNLGLMEMTDGNYEKARSYFERYLSVAPPDAPGYDEARLGVANCDFAEYAIKHPVEFNPVNLGANVNSSTNEYFPALTADESLLLFTRLIPSPNSPDQFDEDFYFSEKKDGQWMPAYNPGPPINSPYKEGAPTLSPDGKYIIFTTCERFGDYGPGKNGYGSCDLFISERVGNSWSNPQNMGRTINSPHWETQPSFASDGRTLYFIRGIKSRSGQQQSDIYVSKLVNGRWSRAEKLPSNINTPQNEESVFIHPDNQTLYFSSQGHVGMGDMDIYVSRKNPDGSWSDPVNLGYPINTSGQENSFHVSASGTYALIASDRPGGYGGLDLYAFELPEAVRPQPVKYLKGKITNAANGKPIEASFELIDLQSGDTVVRSQSDRKNGSFLVVLPVGRSYALIADKPGFLYYSENFQLEQTDGDGNYEKNIELQPIEPGKSVILKNVFFDTDKYELKPESITELTKLANLMKENPDIKIEVSGHTDSQGSRESNQILSENRAKAVAAFLVRSGIEPDRIVARGYGQEKPIADNSTEEGRALNRRTEFTILE